MVLADSFRLQPFIVREGQELWEEEGGDDSHEDPQMAGSTFKQSWKSVIEWLEMKLHSYICT